MSRIDPATIRKLPWEPGVAYAVVDAFEPNGDDNPVAPRTALQRVLKEYAKIGLTPVIGPELEFYLAKQENNEWISERWVCSG